MRKNEPNTLAYQAMKVRKTPDLKGFTPDEDFMIFEQYATPQDLDEVHVRSKEFKAFNSSFKDSALKLEPKFQKRYRFSGIGFLSRPEEPEEEKSKL